MSGFKWLAVIIASSLVLVSGYTLSRSTHDAASAKVSSFTSTVAAAPSNGLPSTAATNRYQLDASRSKFIAHALAGGLFWFKGHDHLVAVRDFTGEAVLDPDSVANSSLQITAKTASMEETSSVFTAPQKQIINKELREIVLLPDQYPDIIFKSTAVSGKSTAPGQYDLKITGNLTLHGVTRPVTIPTKVTVTGNDLRAQGEFSISRDDFNVKATSAFHGLVRVRDKVKFEFDIVGRQL